MSEFFPLPDWSEIDCKKHIGDDLTLLEQFIHRHEPPDGEESLNFRSQLCLLLQQAVQSQGATYATWVLAQLSDDGLTREDLARFLRDRGLQVFEHETRQDLYGQIDDLIHACRISLEDFKVFHDEVKGLR